MKKIRAVQRVSVLQFTKLEAWTRKWKRRKHENIYSIFSLHFHHSGWLPPDLTALRPGYLDDDPVYHCPAREGKSEVTDYEYFGRGHKISDPPFLLMAERDGNHQFHYRNMMLSDGTNCSRQEPDKK